METARAVALAEALYRALGEGDRATLDAVLHDDFNGHVTAGMPAGLGGDYAGADAMRRGFWGRLGQLFEARAVPQRFERLENGELLVAGHYRGRARGSGQPLDAEFLHRLDFRDGRIVHLRQLTDSARWQDALGDEAPYETVRFSVSDGLAELCLVRVAARNAIDLRMATELQRVAVRCSSDPAIRALLIRAEGPAFTVGGDLAFLAEVPPEELPAMLRRMTAAYHQALAMFASLPYPVVTAAQGAAAGGGLGLIHVADLALVATDLRVALGFGTLGLSMDGGNSWYLPRRVGDRRAAELYFEGRVLDAGEAVAWGLATRQVATEDLEQAARTLAGQLARGPSVAFGEARRLLHGSTGAPLPAQLLHETGALSRSAASADAHEGIRAFLARRKPVFTGR